PQPPNVSTQHQVGPDVVAFHFDVSVRGELIGVTHIYSPSPWGVQLQDRSAVSGEAGTDARPCAPKRSTEKHPPRVRPSCAGACSYRPGSNRRTPSDKRSGH